MFFKNDELKFLSPFYIESFISGLSMMIMPFFFIYFRGIGLSYFQISTIMFANGLAVFLFEIPTGAFADSISRKYSVIVGIFITVIPTIAIPFIENYYFLLAMWALAGFGMTFMSGAGTAWIIDNLKHVNRPELIQEYFVKSGSIMAAGAVIAPLVGAWVVKNYEIKYLWFVFGAGFFINGCLLLFVKEEYTPKKVKMSDLVKATLSKTKMGLGFVSTRKVILFLLLAGLFSRLMDFGIMGVQPFLVSLGLEEHQLGYLFSCIAGIAVIMPYFTKMFKKYDTKTSIILITLLKSLLFFSVLFIYPPFFYLGCTVFVLRRGLFSMESPILEPFFHKFIPSTIRATVISIQSMSFQLVTACTALLAGGLMDEFGPQKVIATGGVFGLVAIYMFTKIKE